MKIENANINIKGKELVIEGLEKLEATKNTQDIIEDDIEINNGVAAAFGMAVACGSIFLASLYNGPASLLAVIGMMVGLLGAQFGIRFVAEDIRDKKLKSAKEQRTSRDNAEFSLLTSIFFIIATVLATYMPFVITTPKSAIDKVMLMALPITLGVFALAEIAQFIYFNKKAMNDKKSFSTTKSDLKELSSSNKRVVIATAVVLVLVTILSVVVAKTAYSWISLGLSTIVFAGIVAMTTALYLYNKKFLKK